VTEIVGYADRLTAHPGEPLAVMVSTDASAFDASLVRIVHGDVNPDGPGAKHVVVDHPAAGTYPGRVQPVFPGSFAVVPASPALAGLRSFTIGLWIWPTRPLAGPQALMALDGAFWLGIDDAGCPCLRAGADVLTLPTPLKERQWAWVWATLDASDGRLALAIESPTWPAVAESTAVHGSAPADVPGSAPLTMAAAGPEIVNARWTAGDHYDGKLEDPVLLAWVADAELLARLRDGFRPGGATGAWAFAEAMASDRIVDRSGAGQHGTLWQHPARAMTAHAWDTLGDARSAPEQYGAIHFHSDDIEDCGWSADVELTLPEDLPSGVYALRLEAGDDVEHVVFVVSPSTGPTPGTDTAILFPTLSYGAYANERMQDHPKLQEPGWLNLPIVEDRGDQLLHAHPEFGGSIYDSHSDGSGVCYSSFRRPVLNMRPDHRNWQTHAPRALSSDLYIVDWLEHLGVAHDALTDHELCARGAELLSGYRVIITGTHPEYYSLGMFAALEQWLDAGGRLMYLGGNGFYWITSVDPYRPHVVEVRRGIAGTRTWESCPGELRHSSTGEPGGLWRYRGKDPNRLVGNGFAAQGFDEPSPGYAKTAGAADPRASWILDGVEDDVFGEFGLILGGTSGDEIDRVDPRWGSPPHTITIATSQGRHSEFMQLVSEDIPVTHPNTRGTLSDDIRSDICFLETGGGGAVFSVGSMAWTGGLSHARYDNAIARIAGNVLTRFRDPEPFPAPVPPSAAVTAAR